MTVEIFVFCGWRFSNQLRHILPAILLTVSCGELYLARCCALKQIGTFASESKVMYFILPILKSDVLMFHSRHQSAC